MYLKYLKFLNTLDKLLTYLNSNVTIVLQKDFLIFQKCYKGVKNEKENLC